MTMHWPGASRYMDTISCLLLISTNGDKEASAYGFNLNDNDFNLNIVLAKVDRKSGGN